MKTIRATIHKALPGGEERMSYGIAGYFEEGAVAYFAGFKNHIGFFPPTHDPKLKKAAAKYAGPKGNLKFPLSILPPYELISKLVKARAAENQKNAAKKETAKKIAPKTAKKKTKKNVKKAAKIKAGK
jgi:uncharacterized protein YdhG (YjbR/CyaY superfamily)